MNMKEWARNEVKIACEKEKNGESAEEWDYGVACYKSALKAFESLCEDVHSGASISITQNILNRLIQGKCLTPIEDIESVWNECDFGINNSAKSYQCKRMSSLFKKVYDDGTVKYSDVSRVVMIDKSANGTAWHNKLCDDIVCEIFPITMPYIPLSNPFKVYARTYTTKDNGSECIVPGEYNTIYIDYITTPEGKKIEMSRKYVEDKSGKMVLV